MIEKSVEKGKNIITILDPKREAAVSAIKAVKDKLVDKKPVTNEELARLVLLVLERASS